MKFDVNVATYQEADSTSVVNVAHEYMKMLGAIERWWEHRKLLCRSLPTEKGYLIKAFGKQQVVRNYSYKNWIWTFQSSDAVLYVLWSKRGVSWEFDRKRSQGEQAALALLNAVVNTLIERNTPRD